MDDQKTPKWRPDDEVPPAVLLKEATRMMNEAVIKSGTFLDRIERLIEYSKIARNLGPAPACTPVLSIVREPS